MKLPVRAAALAMFAVLGGRTAFPADPDAPTIVWSILVPRSQAAAFARDSARRLWVVGPGSPSLAGSGDALGVAQISDTGVIVRSSLIGGPVLRVVGAAFDSSGGLWVAGRTVPTAAGWNGTPLGLSGAPAQYPERGFVARLVEAPDEPSGWVVQRSSFVFADVRGLAVGADDAVWVTGDAAPDYPGSSQAMVARIPTSGSAPTERSVAGGHGDGLALARDGHVYVVGEAFSFSTTPGAYEVPGLTGQNIRAPVAFVVRLDPLLSIEYGTMLAGSGGQMGASAVTVDASGAAVVAGWTMDDHFDVRGGFQLQYRGGSTGNNDTLRGDGFASRFDAFGTDLLYSSYLGGSDDEYVSCVRIDDAGRILLVGASKSPNFPAVHAFGEPPAPGEESAFVAATTASGDALRYSSRLTLGGAPTDVAVLAPGVYAVGAGRTVTLVHEPDAPPMFPANVRAARIAGDRVRISWADISVGETAFMVSRESDVAPEADVATLPPGTTSYLDEGVDARTAYVYRVRARDASGDSAASEVAVGGTSASWTVRRRSARVTRSRWPGQDRLAFRIDVAPASPDEPMDILTVVRTGVLLYVGSGADPLVIDARALDPALGIPTNPSLPGWSSGNGPRLLKWTWNSTSFTTPRVHLKLSLARGRVTLKGDVRQASIPKSFPRRPPIAFSSGERWGATTK